MIFNDKYIAIKILNSGTHGTLLEVKEKLNEENHYALKLMKKNLSSEYEKEIEVMKNKNIKSEYIIELKDNFYDKINEGFCIVMELCDGSIKDILEKYKPKGLPLNIINKIFYQLNEALKVMNKNGYTHRDLKPENILIKYTDYNKINFDIKLTDFGLSTYEIHSSINNHSLAGTLNYMAPEIEKFNYNNKCDLWSLGVILYELYTNNYIFYSNDPKEESINRYDGKIVNVTDNKMINKLIKKLIQVDINKRIKWEEYFNDEFFKLKMNDIEKITFDVIIVGDSNVGKTCFIKKLLDENFDLRKNKPKVTIYVERYIYETSINGKRVKISFLDTGNDYQNFFWFLIERACAFLIVFDLTDEVSFDNIIYWVDKIKENFDISKVDLIIVANKCDLERKISRRRIENFEKKNSFGTNYMFYETSALTGEGIKICLEGLINKITYKYEHLGIGNEKKIILKFDEKKKHSDKNKCLLY